MALTGEFSKLWRGDEREKESENPPLKAGESERNNGVLIWIPGADAFGQISSPSLLPSLARVERSGWGDPREAAEAVHRLAIVHHDSARPSDGARREVLRLRRVEDAGIPRRPEGKGVIWAWRHWLGMQAVVECAVAAVARGGDR